MNVRRHAMDWLRAGKRDSVESSGDEELPVAAFVELARDGPRRSDLRFGNTGNQSWRLSTKWPREQRGAVELAFFRGLTEAEIAQHSGKSLGIIRSQVCFGMKNLRDRLILRREGEL